MDGKPTVEAPNRAWLKLLRASLYLLHGHETKGPAATRAVQYARENKAIFHSWSRGWKFLMSEISRLPRDTGETWRIAKLLKSE